MKYLIVHELNNKTKNYTELFDTIKSSGTTWWHYLETTWIIESDKTPDKISNIITPYIDKSQDFVLVVKIDAYQKQGWLPKEAWDWLNK